MSHSFQPEMGSLKSFSRNFSNGESLPYLDLTCTRENVAVDFVETDKTQDKFMIYEQGDLSSLKDTTHEEKNS